MGTIRLRQVVRALGLSLILYGLLCVLTTSPAFAQTAPNPLQNVSAATAVVMLLSVLLGAVTQMIQTGTFLGKWVAPKSWLPDLTIAATFLGGAISYLSSQSPLVLNGTTIAYAVISGVTSLFAGAAPGFAVHAHVVVPGHVRALRAAAQTAAPPPSTPPSTAAATAGFIRLEALRVLTLISVIGVCLVPGIIRQTHAQRVTDVDTKPAAVEVQSTETPSVESPRGMAPVELSGGIVEGCGWINSSGGAATEQAGEQIAQCIFEQLLQGNLDPDGVALICGGVALSQVLSILDSILAYYTQSPDAGAPGDGGAVGATLCGIGKPPVLGANQCISANLVGQVRSMRVTVAAKVGSGAR